MNRKVKFGRVHVAPLIPHGISPANTQDISSDKQKGCSIFATDLGIEIIKDGEKGCNHFIPWQNVISVELEPLNNVAPLKPKTGA